MSRFGGGGGGGRGGGGQGRSGGLTCPAAEAMSMLKPELFLFFTPDEPIPFLEPPAKGKHRELDGVSYFVDSFETTAPPAREAVELPKQRRQRLKKAAMAEHSKKLKGLREEYKPKENSTATSVPLSTLFVGRLSYETTEATLQKEFGSYGPVSEVKLVKDKEGNSRGYAFVQFESETDMKDAYRRADGRKLDGRRIVVDVERGRTVPGWLPRRLGGGLGGTRIGGKADNLQYVGRDVVRKEPVRYAPPSRYERPSGGYGGGGAGGGGGYRGGGGGGGYRERERDRDYRGGGGDRDRDRRDRDRDRDRDRGGRGYGGGDRDRRGGGRDRYDRR